jgi:pimeloyl-ACP methyl ester carboxylesterase
MFYSVVCAEDIPFVDSALIGTETETYFRPALDPLRQACRFWPQTAIPADFREPVAANVPVLLLSGEADPVTPPYYAEQTAETLPNSLHLIASGQGHITMGRGCIADLAGDFVDSGRLSGLETGCLQRLKPPPFFINFAGPHP